MSDNLRNSIENEIDKALGMTNSRKSLSEAYVIEPKKFELKTELLGGRTKRARQEEFETGTKSVNEISAELDTADRHDVNEYHSHFRNLKLDEAYNASLSVLRAAHFKNISSLASIIAADSISFMRLERDFASFDEWQRDFIACGCASRSGFVITAYNITLKRYQNYIVDNSLAGMPMGAVYVIVLDVSEGAYYRDYANDKKTYISAMMKEFDWEEIETRVKRAERVARVYDAK